MARSRASIIISLVAALLVLIASIASLKAAEASLDAAIAVFCKVARSAGLENLTLQQEEHYKEYCLPPGGE